MKRTGKCIRPLLWENVSGPFCGPAPFVDVLWWTRASGYCSLTLEYPGRFTGLCHGFCKARFVCEVCGDGAIDDAQYLGHNFGISYCNARGNANHSPGAFLWKYEELAWRKRANAHHAQWVPNPMWTIGHATWIVPVSAVPAAGES